MTPDFIRSWVEREELDSTSTLARSLVADPGAACPMLVRARRQTQGRGRDGRSWWSDEGSLTVTLVLDPEDHGLRDEHQPRTALAVAVAIVEALAPIVSEPKRLGVRWPNDVEWAGKKIAGILPERVDSPAGPRLLIGLGLNVATGLDRAPDEIRGMAASLHELVPIGAPRPGVGEVLQRLLQRLPETIHRLAGDDPTLAARWASLDALYDTPVEIDLGTRRVNGVARGIDPEGALLLSADGEIRRVFGGQVLRGGAPRPRSDDPGKAQE